MASHAWGRPITTLNIMYKLLKIQAEEERKEKVKEFEDKLGSLRACRDHDREFRAILAQQLVHGDRDWGKQPGTSKKTYDRKRRLEAEAAMQDAVPVKVVPAKEEGKSGRFYAKNRLPPGGESSWPEERKSCP